jgi:hypothetical protein
VLSRLIALAPSSRRTVIATLLALPLISLGLRLFGPARVRNVFARNGDSVSQAADTHAARQLGHLVNAVAERSPIQASCLARSVWLEWLLHRRGIASQLRIGVRFADGELDAHAWIECEGTPVNDRADIGEAFTPFAGAVPPLSSLRR